MLAVELIVVVIAQSPEAGTCEPGACGGPALVSAFQQAAQRVLGSDARIRTEVVAEDPPDVESAARAQEAAGVVELSFAAEGQKARVHCYVTREKRWLDREISFGESRGSGRSELSERGRLLGFAVATMYAAEPQQEPEDAAAATPPAAPAAAPASLTKPPLTESPDRTSAPSPEVVPRRTAEFGAIISSGLGGTASGLGASAGFRLGLHGPLWGRLFVAGRTGNIPAAQASTRTALLGGGVALALLPQSSSFDLGVRADAFASYFDASHLSEDDIEPDLRSRWQVGGDLLAEGAFRITRAAGISVAAGLEGVVGKTEVYTHHKRVAVVPPFRAVAELGFRTHF
ncbi:MAG TPA: hypothetical protein VHP33_19355 [Polyangiaceae bacterium]|nr:hypothetical protein [Polyangiaceae bacterium]